MNYLLLSIGALTLYKPIQADLNWNSLTKYLNTFKLELNRDVVGYPDPINHNNDLSDQSAALTSLKMRVPINLSSTAGPPLLSMFPGGQHDYKKSDSMEDDVGEPLMLTPYIEQNKIKEAREASKVSWPPLANIAGSHSGFFTVDKEFNSNIFFWHIPAKVSPKTAPLIVWLQGGPGGSSLFGLFIEHGPYLVNKDQSVTARNFTWAKDYNMLYIDQPVGTGFSFTDSESGLANNQIDVANGLYETLKQFYTVFPELQQNDLYITGESYAGKYVPAISYKIHKMNKEGKAPHMPLKGLAIGDGLSDPINQMSYGEFLFQVGLVDENDRDRLIRMSKVTEQYIRQGRWAEAAEMFDKMMEFFGQKSGLTFVYNYLLQGQPDQFTYYPKFLNSHDVRKAIHVGNLSYSDINENVYEHLKKDIPKSVKPWIETLLDRNYKVMIYSGQVDVIIAHPQTEKMISGFHWKGSEKYNKAERKIWKVNGNVAGYVREVENLRQVMVRNSGHILPFDQPFWGYDMIKRFIENQSFGSS